MLIFSVYSLISSSSSANQVTFSFLVLSTLKILNDLGNSTVSILSFFTSCLSIPTWVHSELTSALSHSSFSFNVFTFVYTLSSFSLLSLLYEIIY